MIARIQVRETAWDALLAEDRGVLYSAAPEVERLLGLGQTRKIDAQNPVGFILVDAIGSEGELDALFNYFAPADTGGYWKWGFDGKVNYLTEYTGQHDDILATQPGGSSFETPDWVHGWEGQDENRFAREFSREFGEEFG